MGTGSYGGGYGDGDEGPSSGKSKSGGGSKGGYSGKGGHDSPSEGGPGPGGSANSGGKGKSSGGGYSGGKGSHDSPSEGGSRFGGSGLSGGKSKSSGGGGNSPSEGGSRFGGSGLGSSKSSTGGRGRDGFGASSARDSTIGKGLSPDRPDNHAAAGPTGLGGVGGLYVGGAPVDQTRARRDMAQSMDAAGIRSLAGKPAPAAPSHRQSEIQSMQDLAKYNAPTHRQTEIASMDKMHAWDGILGLARLDAAKIDPYNSLTYGKKGVPTHADLTNMTIGEVMQYQKGMKKAGHASTAVGAYQTVASTLADAVQLSGLSLDTKFSPATQDFLAMGLVDRRASFATDPTTGVVDVDKFADQLTKEWASFKNKTGKGTYDGFNNNKGYVGYDKVRSAAANLVGTGTIGGKATAALGSVPAGKKESRLGFQSLPNVGPTPTPADRFRGTYLGNTKPGRLSDENAAASLSPEQDYFGEQPSSQYDRNPAGIPVGGANSPAGSAAPASPSLAGPATRGPATAGPATAGPAGTVAPGTPSVAPAAPSVAPDKPYQRSTAGSIIATGIDVGLGMTGLPGMGVGLLNAGLSLTGRNTIGESIVDRMAQGKDINTGSTESRGDWSRRRAEEREAAGKNTPEEIEEPIITSTGPAFIDKYLRPTPKERFLDGREAYAGREYPETRTA